MYNDTWRGRRGEGGTLSERASSPCFHSHSAVVVRASSPLQQHKTRLVCAFECKSESKSLFINTEAVVDVDNTEGVQDSGDADVAEILAMRGGR